MQAGGCAQGPVGGWGVGTAHCMPSVSSGHPIPWALPSLLAAPSARGVLELRVGLPSPGLNQIAESHVEGHKSSQAPTQTRGLIYCPALPSLFIQRCPQAPSARASEMCYSSQTRTAHLRQLCGSFSLDFPITGSKYCWDSVIAQLQPISITDEV